jgi:hypothetical protein
MANMAEVEIDKKMHGDILHKSLTMTAWLQIGGMMVLGLILLIIVLKLTLFRKKRRY